MRIREWAALSVFYSLVSLGLAATVEQGRDKERDKELPATAKGFELVAEVEKGSEGERRLPLDEGLLSVAKEPVVRQPDVKRAFASETPGGWTIVVEIKKEAAGRFFELTKKLAPEGKRIAIVVDGKVLSAPVVREAIPGGMVSISGDYTREEAKALAAAIGGKGD